MIDLELRKKVAQSLGWISVESAGGHRADLRGKSPEGERNYDWIPHYEEDVGEAFKALVEFVSLNYPSINDLSASIDMSHSGGIRVSLYLNSRWGKDNRVSDVSGADHAATICLAIISAHEKLKSSANPSDPTP